MDLLKYVRKNPKPRATNSSEPCPYTNAKREWNHHTGSTIASRGYWQILGTLSMLIALSAVAGVIHIGSQSKFIPYVVEVDKLGQQMAVAPVSKAKKADPRVIQTSLSRWIFNLRMVTPDVILQRKAIFEVYANLSLNDPATHKVNEWFNASEEQSAFVRAKKVTVHVQIDSVMPQTPDTWQVDWTETERDRQGKLTRPPYKMRALINAYVIPPPQGIKEADLRKNPIGVFVKDYNWSEQL